MSSDDTYTALADSGAGEAEDERERKGGCLRKGCLTLILIIIAILLLLLFWPVKKPKTPPVVKRPARGKITIGSGRIGNARYGDISVLKTGQLGEFIQATSKGVLVLLRFEVRNLSGESQVFDTSTFALSDGGARVYPPDSVASAKYADDTGQDFTFPRRVGPHKSIRVWAVFQVEKASTKVALVGRDFDLTRTESLTVVVPVNRIRIISPPKRPGFR